MTENPPEAGRQASFRDPTPLARAVVIWLHIFAASLALFAVGNVMRIGDAAANPDLAADAVLPSDLVYGLAGIPFFVAFIVTGFLILKWSYRVSMNAKATGHAPSISPGWAIGWYFIPIANLWMPFQALKRVWRVSAGGDAWRTVKTPAIMRWWWGFWIAGGFAWNASDTAGTIITGMAGIAASSALTILAASLHIVTCLLLVRVVRKISQTQSIAMVFSDVPADGVPGASYADSAAAAARS